MLGRIGIALALFALVASSTGAEGKKMAWFDASKLTVEGRGWQATEGFFQRLPARAKGIVRPDVWNLSTNSAGIVVRFLSDSPDLSVRWKLNSKALNMFHMPSTGMSGVDLYVRRDGKWRWLAIGQIQGQENESKLFSGIPAQMREFALYLPLYNGVSSVELGIAEGAKLDPAPARKGKPVVFYGTSITQGGCASRPGMAYPAIIGRQLDIETVNLGFSGNGRGEPEVSDLLAELDPSVFVIDPLPNMTAEFVAERIPYMLKVLKEKHPNTPVILVESIIYQNAFIWSDKAKPGNPKNPVLAKVYKDAAPAWNGRLHYVKGDQLLGADGEATVDGTHATDLGFLRMAEVLGTAIKKVLAEEK